MIVTHDLGSIFVAMDRVILLDRKAKGIIAHGDPRKLRDESERSARARVLPPRIRSEGRLTDRSERNADEPQSQLLQARPVRDRRRRLRWRSCSIIIGSGRAFQQKITIETYFNESVQGLDIGSKVKYRGVVIGEVTKISFTYVRYQLDKPMSERLRYVLVEAQLQPKLLGGKRGLRDHRPRGGKAEVARGLRVRSAPQGITGTNYLEMDYIEPPPPLLPFDWTPDNVYIPSAPSTVAALVNSASEIMDRLHKLDVEGTIANLNRLMVTTNDRVAAIDTKALSLRTERVLAKIESTLDSVAAKKLSDEGVALLAEMRETNAELKKMLANPALQKLPEDAAAAMARVRRILDDPNLQKTIAHLAQTLSPARPDPGRGRVGHRGHRREPPPDHRQPARPHRGHQALSGERVPREAAATAGARQMKPSFPSLPRRSPVRPLAAIAAVLLAATLAACSLSRPAPVKQHVPARARRRRRSPPCRSSRRCASA